MKYLFTNTKFSGGTYRFLVSLLYLDFELYLPRNVLHSLLNFVDSGYVEEKIQGEIKDALLNSEVIKPMPFDKLSKIRYYSGLKLRDPLYFPSEDFVFNISFNKKAVQLLQLTPVVGTWLIDEKASLLTIKKNEFLKRCRNVDTRFAAYTNLKLKLYRRVNRIYISVSPSIEYELRVMRKNLKVVSLFPGNGTFAKPVGLDKVYDIIYVGNKGFEDFIQIIKLLDSRINHRIRLLVVSSRKKEIPKTLRNVIIRVIGFQTKDELYKVLEQSKILLYPSKVDSFSLLVLESIALGTPAVAYDIPAMRFNYKTEAVQKVKINDLQTMVSAIVKLLSDDSLLDKLSKEGRKYSRGFKWKSVFRTEKKSY